jgi:hypothetical protein
MEGDDDGKFGFILVEYVSKFGVDYVSASLEDNLAF